MIIDTHHHYWNYNTTEFGWIDDEMAVIRRNFLPADLKETINKAGVDGVITVQARQYIEETDWLLRLASQNDFMFGVIGWVPLVKSDIIQILERYSANSLLKGVRHVVQGETDPDFLQRDDFNNGISLLKEYNLVYDILIFEHQLPNAIRFVDRHPNQKFVLDHIAKPRIKVNEMKPWAENLKEIGKRENVSCKISGMVTEADFKNWTESQLQPYFDVVLEAFRPERLLFGSDWPVCLVATEYTGWLGLVKKVLSQLSKNEQNMIFYRNAQQVYKIEK